MLFLASILKSKYEGVKLEICCQLKIEQLLSYFNFLSHLMKIYDFL